MPKTREQPTEKDYSGPTEAGGDVAIMKSVDERSGDVLRGYSG